MQPPNDEDGQKPDGEIQQRSDDAICVAHVDEDVGWETAAGHPEAVPEVIHRVAGKDEEEEEERSDEDGTSDNAVEDQGVRANDGDAEEGDRDGDLGQHASDDVEDLAQPPTLRKESVQSSQSLGGGISAQTENAHTSIADRKSSRRLGTKKVNSCPIP